MNMESKFFGKIEYTVEDIIHFKNGLPGFKEETQFLYLTPSDSRFTCLQSVKSREVAFIMISPFDVCPDYAFELDDNLAEEMGFSNPEEATVLAIVTVPPGEPKKATVNLQGPVVLNLRQHLGCQVIINDLNYPLRLPLWKEGNVEAAASTGVK